MAKENGVLVLTGVSVGVIVFILSLMGNPPNMAFCSVCFLRDAVGSLGLHGASAYMRPEIPGVVAGAFAAAFLGKDFNARGGSSPFTRLTLGVCVSVGALIFLGCPFRMLLRLAGGDVNAVLGLAGFAAGVGAGAFFLQAGFSLNRSYALPKTEGYLFPIISIILVALVMIPSVSFAESGLGLMRAPVYASAAAGVAIGFVGRRARLCFVSGARDLFLFKQYGMLICFAALFATVAAGNIYAGKFFLGVADQPAAHADLVWNFLGMALTGCASALLGGCPFRQLTLAGGGDADSAVTVIGIAAGTALSHNLGLASTPDGPTAAGKAAFAVCLAVTLAIACANIKRTDASGGAA